MNNGFTQINSASMNGLLDINADSISSSTIDATTISVNGVDITTQLSQVSTNQSNISTLQQQTTGISYDTIGDLTTISNNVSITGTLTTTPSLATQTYVNTQISALVNSAPATLDTLSELALSLGNDPSFAASTAALIGTKASLTANQTISGINTLNNPSNVFYGSGANLTGVVAALPANTLTTNTVQSITANKTMYGSTLLIDDGTGNNTTILQDKNNFNFQTNNIVASFYGEILSTALNVIVCEDGSNPSLAAGNVISGVFFTTPMIVSTFTNYSTSAFPTFSVNASSLTITYPVGMAGFQIGQYFTGNPTIFTTGTYITAVNTTTRVITLNQATKAFTPTPFVGTITYAYIVLTASTTFGVGQSIICASNGQYTSFNGRVIAASLNHLIITTPSPLTLCKIYDKVLYSGSPSNLQVQNITMYNNIVCSFNIASANFTCGTLLDIGSIYTSSVISAVLNNGVYITGFTFPNTYTLSQLPLVSGAYTVSFATFVLNQYVAAYSATTSVYSTSKNNIVIQDYNTGQANTILSATSNNINVNGSLSMNGITYLTKPIYSAPSADAYTTIINGVYPIGYCVSYIQTPITFTTAVASLILSSFTPLTAGVWLISIYQHFIRGTGSPGADAYTTVQLSVMAGTGVLTPSSLMMIPLNNSNTATNWDYSFGTATFVGQLTSTIGYQQITRMGVGTCVRGIELVFTKIA